MKSKVFFSSEITAEKVVELFHAAANDLPGGILPGKVAVKLHSGEPGNQNFLKPEFWQPILRVRLQYCESVPESEPFYRHPHRRKGRFFRLLHKEQAGR